MVRGIHKKAWNKVYIKDIKEGKDSYAITEKDGWVFLLFKKWGIEPKITDDIEVATIGFSYIVGIKINGKTLFDKSYEEIEKDRIDQIKKFDNDNKAYFEKVKDQLDKDYESLPQPFKDRIDKFRKNNPNFRWKYEAYEMVAIREAINMIATFKDLDKFIEFQKKPSHEVDDNDYKCIEPDLTGNQFGAARHMAYRYLKGISLTEMPGVGTILSGGIAYGDVERSSFIIPEWKKGLTPEEERDIAYKERNLLALKFADGWYYDDENKWEGYLRVLSLKNGKITFHIPDDFPVGNLPQIKPNWNGHSTFEKWQNILIEKEVYVHKEPYE